MSNEFWNALMAVLAMAMILRAGYDLHRRHRGPL